MHNREIKFLLRADLPDTVFNPHRPEGLVFKSSSPEVYIKITSKSEDGFGNLEAKIYCEWPATPTQCEFVTALVRGRYSLVAGAPITLPYCSHGEEKIDKAGNLQKGFRIKFECMPGDLQSICSEVEEILLGKLLRLLKLLQWRQDIDGSHNPVESNGSLYWKTEGEDYHLVPLRKQVITAPSPVGIRWEPVYEEELTELWVNPDADPPLAHELLREAASALSNNPRSALLIACSALEVGVKQHIGKIVPKANWLVFEVPSPPIPKILRKYLPELHAENDTVNDWQKLQPLIKTIDSLVADRNKLTHAGHLPERESICTYVSAVHDILYILDALEGHVWAREFVNHETRNALGWPGPRDPRMYVTLSV